MQQQTDSLPVTLVDAGEDLICWPLNRGDIQSIRWSRGLLDSLCQEFSASSESGKPERGGLLFGLVELGQPGVPSEVLVSLAHPVRCSHSLNSLFHLSDIEKSGLLASVPEWIQYSRWSLVGFYRSHQRPTLQLDHCDRTLANQHLAARIIFLIKPDADDGPVGSLFAREQGRLLETPVLSFRLGLKKPIQNQAKPDQSEAFAQYSQLVDNLSGAADIATASLRRTGIPRFYWWMVAAVLSAYPLFICLQKLTSRKQVQVTPATATNTKGPGELGLKATVEADHLRVTWNQKIPISDPGVPAVLVVKDGLFRNLIPLNPAVMQARTLTYFPVTAKVTFELQLGGVVDTAVVTGIPEKPQLVPNRPTEGENQPGTRPSAAGSLSHALSDSKPIIDAAKPLSKPIAAAKGDRKYNLNTRVVRPEVAQVSELPPPPGLSSAPTVLSDSLQRLVVPSISAKPPIGEAKDRGVYLPPQSLKRVVPKAPASVSRLLVSLITDRVKVHTDVNGNVVRAESLSRGSALMNYLSTISEDAAKKWVFRPAQEGTRVIASETVVEFSFAPQGN